MVVLLVKVFWCKFVEIGKISQDVWEDGEFDFCFVVGWCICFGKFVVLCSYGFVFFGLFFEIVLVMGMIYGFYLGSVVDLELVVFLVVYLFVMNFGFGIIVIEMYVLKV